MDTQGDVMRRDLIVRQIRKLSAQMRKDIIGTALRELDEDITRPYGPDRYNVLKEIAEIATGYKLTDSRARTNIDIRAIVAKEMAMEGYSTTEIGAFMNRDHSTVSYYTQTMDAALQMPQAFADLIRKNERFKSILYDYDRRTLQRPLQV